MIAKYRIYKDNIQNFNKTKFIIDQILSVMVIISSEGCRKVKIVQPGNREQTTVIQGINLYGWAILSFIVVVSKHYLILWYRDSPLPSDWVVTLSDNGWIINEISFNQVKYFNKYSYSYIKSIYYLLVLDSYKSYYSIDFKGYYKQNNIIIFYILIYLLYLF